MFQIGALNPSQGNDRRKQLLQTLMQQFMQRQGAGMPGEPAPPTFARPMFGTPAHPPAVRGAATSMTHPQMIPSSVMALLGPGGANRASSMVMSPVAGAPVAGLGRGGSVPPVPGPGGGVPGTPAPPNSAPNIPPSTNAPAPLDPNTAIAALHQNEQQPPSSPIGLGALPPGPQPRDIVNQLPANFGGTPGGLVPLGNGVFFDPATGMLHGVPGPTLGSDAASRQGGNIFTNGARAV